MIYTVPFHLFNTKDPVLAGCVTGGGLGIMAGPQAAAFGCVGFAAFSGLIDYFLQ
jgi:mitochondrial import inner membrane translocase subunit TIM22